MIVAFLSCSADAQNFANSLHLLRLVKAVRNAIQAGADIVNISFSLAGRAQSSECLPALQSVFESEWLSSVAQPAYSSRTEGSVMSFWSPSRASLLSEAVLDPEGCLPAIALTFSAPVGRICTIATSLSAIATRTRERLLKLYATTAASTEAENVFIGGAFEEAVVYMENQVKKWVMEFEVSSNGNLCLFTHAPEGTSTNCVALDTAESFSLLVIVERTSSTQSSAERAAADHGSAEQPVSRPAVRLRPCTPWYDSLIASLETATKRHPEGGAFVNFLTNSCFCGKLLTINDLGEPLTKPMPLAVKMEDLLKEAQRQRDRYINRLTRSSRSTRLVNAQMVLSDDDMKNIHNKWCNNPKEWMHSSTYETYTEMLRSGPKSKAHDLAKSRFSNHLFKPVSYTHLTLPTKA